MKRIATFLIAAVFGILSCKKTIVYDTYTLNQLEPWSAGHYVTYRLDSLNYVSYGQKDTIISYLAKDVVDDSVVDAAGQPSWRIIRYLSDTTGTQPWIPSLAYLITITQPNVQVLENNLRYIKLAAPVKADVSWKGNSYIDTRSDTSQVPYLDDWTYEYANIGETYSTLAGDIPETVTVNEVDNTTGESGSFTETVQSQEVYAKGVGLIYRNFFYSQYQPPNALNPAGLTTGYGVRLNMVDHN